MNARRENWGQTPFQMKLGSVPNFAISRGFDRRVASRVGLGARVTTAYINRIAKHVRHTAVASVSSGAAVTAERN